MLEEDGTISDELPLDGDTSKSMSGTATSPGSKSAFGDPTPTVKYSPKENSDLRIWDSTTDNNENYFRFPPPTKPEVVVESAQSEGRTTEVATALAGVNAVLSRIDGVAKQQQVLGDVIVHLQVLRCRLQLAQVQP